MIMKKLFGFIGSGLALGALALAGCSKDNQATNGGATVDGGVKFPVTITAKAANASTRTFTYMAGDEYRVSWNNTDQLGVFYYSDPDYMYGDNLGIESIVGDIATFSGELNGVYGILPSTPAPYTYYAYYPYDAAILPEFLIPSSLPLTLPTQQSPTATSFDGAADILLGIPVSVENAKLGKDDNGENINFGFVRPVAVAQFGVKAGSVPAAITSTDYIQSITLEFDKDVAGDVVADITKADPTLDLGATTSKTITLDYTGKNVALTDALKIWWTMFPQSVNSIKVTIETGLYTIVKTVSSAVNFAAGNVVTTANLDLGTNTVVTGSVTPQTLTITPTSTGLAGTYVTGHTWTQEEGFDFTSTEVMKGTPSGGTDPTLQCRAMQLSNTSGFSQITKIIINYDALSTNKNAVVSIGNALGGPMTPVTPVVNGTEYTFNVNSPAGQQAYFTITNSASGSMYIDNIVVEYIPGASALTPPTPAQTAVSSDSFTIEWAAISHATGYQVKVDDGDWSDATGTTYTANNLDGKTTYAVTVKAIGDGTDYLDSPVSQTISVTTTDPNDTHIFRKVTSAPADFTGQYLIVCEAAPNSKGTGGPWVLYDKSPSSTYVFYGPVINSADYDGTAKTIAYNSSTAQYICSITKTGDVYNILSPATATAPTGEYLGFTGTGNALLGGNSTNAATAAYQWNIAINGGNAVITNANAGTNTRQICFNYNSNSTRFACYTSFSSVDVIQLYVLADN